MGAKDIIAKKFEMVLRGYKTEEVDEFLREVSLSVSQMQKEKEDLEKKLEVLANKIREYREDEDTLKDALLGAQRQGNALIADSKRKAAEIIEETENKRDAMLKKAEEDRQKLQEKGENQIAAAMQEAEDIIRNANDAAADIEEKMNLRTDVQKEILHRTSSEISKFKHRIIEAYKVHIDFVEQIAEACENEFITDILKEEKPELGKNRGKNRRNKENKAKSGGDNSATPATPANTASLSNTGSVGNTGNIGNTGSIANTGNVPQTSDESKPAEKAVSGGLGDGKDKSVTQVLQEYDEIGYNTSDSEDSEAIKFEIDVNDESDESDESEVYSDIDFSEFSDDEIIEMNIDNIYNSENEGDTGEVPLFKPKSETKQTNEIFFKKTGKNSSKQKVNFGGNDDS